MYLHQCPHNSLLHNIFRIILILEHSYGNTIEVQIVVN